jgi:hypothetical protein
MIICRAELELFPIIRQNEKAKMHATEQYDIIVCEAEAQYNLALHSKHWNRTKKWGG